MLYTKNNITTASWAVFYQSFFVFFFLNKQYRFGGVCLLQLGKSVLSPGILSKYPLLATIVLAA